VFVVVVTYNQGIVMGADGDGCIRAFLALYLNTPVQQNRQQKGKAS